MKNKIYDDAESALQDLADGATIMSGGFGLSGNAEHCIRAIAASGAKDLTIISNNCGNQGQGLAVLLQNHQVKKWIGSYMGGNPDMEQQYLAGEVEVELNPQGTLAERIRAGGAGIGGFYTPTGVGTVIAEGKDERVIDGRRMILETALHADYAIVRAQQADRYGNLRFYGTSRNFSPAMATAARITIAEVEELVETGEIPPDEVHLPGVFVQRIFVGDEFKNPIEHRTTRPRPEA
jgi:3-oxoacid CoA-transferase subunit A